MKTSEISKTGLLIALAMILSYVESCIPSFVAIPGIKVGLANIVVVFALYKLNFKTAAAVSILRVFLASLLFGSFLSLAYSASGAVLSLVVMTLLKRTGTFGTLAVSVAGGVSHNIGQILIACIIMKTEVVAYYLPILVISGTISGIIIGLAGSVVVKRI